MPTATNPPGDDAGVIAAADAAAERAAAANRNGQAGASDTVTESSTVSAERESELDKAFREAAAKEPGATELTEKNLGKHNNGVKVPIEGEPSPEELAAEERKNAEAAAAAEAEAARKAETEAARKPADKPGEKPARKGLLDELAGEETAKPATEADPKKAYDDITLRSDASPKTKETFDMVKTRAAERENAVRTELEAERTRRVELEGRITELEKKAGTLPEDAAAELKELREFRALHDVGSRPEFKQKYDSRISANNEQIYSLLKQEEMPETHLAKLKLLSEAQRAEYLEKNVLPKLTPAQRQFIGAKLYDNVNATTERQAALEAAKADADKILAEQRAAPQKTQQERTVAIASILRPVIEKMPYLHEVEIPATATEAEKKTLEAHNSLALALQEDLKLAIVDDSPKVRAEAAIAVPLARYLSAQLKAASARAEAAEAKLAKITAASATGRLGRSTSSTPAPAPAPKTSDDSGDAVDQLFRAAAASEPTAR